MWVTSADASGIVAELDESGALLANHVLVPGGTYGGACMGTGSTGTLWVLIQGLPDALFSSLRAKQHPLVYIITDGKQVHRGSLPDRDVDTGSARAYK